MAGAVPVPAGAGRPGLLDGMEIPGRPPVPVDPLSFTVRGGPGSIHADLSELDRGGVVLETVGAEALQLSRRAASWGALMNLALAHTAAGPLLQQRTGVLAIGLHGMGLESQELATAVNLSARTYREAEERSRSRFEELIAWTGVDGLVSIPALVAGVWQVTHGQPLPVGVSERVLQGIPSLLTGVLDLASLGLVARGFTVASTTAAAWARDEGTTGAYSAPELLYPLLTWTGRALGVVQIGPVRARETVPTADEWEEAGPQSGTGAVTHLMEDLDRASGVAGAIQVTRVTPDAAAAPDTVWVVTLPGTQGEPLEDESGWATNPFEGSGNAEGMALDSQHVSAAVRQVLSEAGAREGDALVFSGYSQGGIHASRLAADERMAADYDVAGILTIGSPVGEIAQQDRAATLNLEHGLDSIVALDGRPNPQTAERTTVTFEGFKPGLLPEGEDPGLLTAHSFENYRFHAERLEASPGVEEEVPVLTQLGALTTGSAVTRTVPLERIRPGNPRHPFGAGSSSSFASGADDSRPSSGDFARRVRPPAPHQLRFQ